LSTTRIVALLVKEWADLRRNRAALLPVVFTALACVTLPFVVTIGIPAMVGEPLSSDDGFDAALADRGWMQPSVRNLGSEPAAQAFIYQQFLVLFAIVPIVGAMAFASHSIISEKQARTLEPLLATPLTTTELLVAKIAASLVPSLLIAHSSAAIYLLLIAAISGTDVAGAILTWRTIFLQLVIGPLAALVALELAVITSSRVNDPRTAQQVGVLVILPLTGLMIAQFAGAFWLTGTILAASAAVLTLAAAGLLAVGVRLFNREAILTRWK
jgi:ABC-2 type transport system permease protein